MSAGFAGYSGNQGGGYPPKDRICGYCRFGNLFAYSGGNGGGGTNTQRVAVEILDDINRAVRALSALVENIAVSCGVKIKACELFPDVGMVNTLVPEIPMEIVDEKFSVGGCEADIGGKVKENGR